jgi:hypothetical protein
MITLDLHLLLYRSDDQGSSPDRTPREREREKEREREHSAVMLPTLFATFRCFNSRPNTVGCRSNFEIGLFFEVRII